jgi:hypothetical protein
MFSILLVVHLFKRYLLEYLSLLDVFVQYSLCSVCICVVQKDIDVTLPSVLLCMPLLMLLPSENCVVTLVTVFCIYLLRLLTAIVLSSHIYLHAVLINHRR